MVNNDDAGDKNLIKECKKMTRNEVKMKTFWLVLHRLIHTTPIKGGLALP